MSESSNIHDLTAVVMADASHSAFEPLIDRVPFPGGPSPEPFALIKFANRPLIDTLLESLRRNFVSTAYIICSSKSKDKVSEHLKPWLSDGTGGVSVTGGAGGFGASDMGHPSSSSLGTPMTAPPPRASATNAGAAPPSLTNLKIKIYECEGNASVASCLRTLLNKSALPDRFVFVPIETVFSSLILPGMVEAHIQNEKNGNVLTVGLNETPGFLKNVYDHLQAKSMIAREEARRQARLYYRAHKQQQSLQQHQIGNNSQGDSSNALDDQQSSSTTPQLPAGKSPTAQTEPNTNGQPPSPQTEENTNTNTNSKIATMASNLANKALKGIFSMSKSDGDVYDADLWTVATDPRKRNTVKQFTSWRELESDQLRQAVQRAMNGKSSADDQLLLTNKKFRQSLLYSDLTIHELTCDIKNEVKIQSNLEFTGIAVCSSALVTDVLQMNGNLVTMVDICRCIVSNAELSDATFATYDLSLRHQNSSSSHQQHQMIENYHHQNHQNDFNSLMTGVAALAVARSSHGPAFRNSFQEMRSGGFQQTPPLNAAAVGFASIFGNTAAATTTQQQQQSANKNAHTDPLSLGSAAIGRGGVASSSMANAMSKKKNPHAPVMNLNLAAPKHEQIGVTDLTSTAGRNFQTPSFFAGHSRPVHQATSIFTLHSISSFIRAHVATASRQLLNISQVLPSYVTHRGHPSIFASIEGLHEISKDALIGPNVIIGANCYVPQGCVLQNCCLGDNVTLARGSVVRDSVLHSDVTVGENTVIRRSVIGKSSVVLANINVKRCLIAPNTRVNTQPPDGSRLISPTIGAPPRSYFETDSTANRTFSAVDLGVETDVTVLYCRLDANRDVDTEDELGDARERLFRAIRPQVERALDQNSPINLLQPNIWRHMLVEMEGYNIDDILECIMRALIQVIGRKYSHKAGSLPTMTPVSRKSTGAKSGLSDKNREFTPEERDAAVRLFLESVLSAWIPNLIIGLIRSGDEKEKDLMAIMDGLCRGVGSNEGAVFADSFTCQRIIGRFMRYGVFNREFLDEFKVNTDKQMASRRPARVTARLSNDLEGFESGTASAGSSALPPHNNSNNNNATDSIGGGMNSREPSFPRQTPTGVRRSSDDPQDLAAANNSDEDDEEDYEEDADEPLYIGWEFVGGDAISKAVPFETGHTFYHLPNLGGGGSLSGMSDFNTNTPAMESQFPGASSPASGGSQAARKKQKQAERAAKKAEKEAKKKKLQMLGLAADSSSSSSDDSDSSSSDSSSDDDTTSSGVSSSSSSSANQQRQQTAVFANTASPASPQRTAEEQAAHEKRTWFLAKDESSSDDDSSSSSDDDDSSSSSSSSDE